MRYAAVVLFTLVFTGAFASQPGQPLDCSDWVFLEPGLTCRLVAAPCVNTACYNLQERAADNAGGLLEAQQVTVSLPPCPAGGTPSVRVQLSRYRDGVPTVVAYVQDRCGVPGTVDKVLMTYNLWGNSGFEPHDGRLFIGLDTSCSPIQNCNDPNTTTRRLYAIEGFTTTFDVLQSYTPQASIGFRVPVRPEGLAGVNHFDTYWGSLAHPLDFAQAHPLRCDYPASSPQIGEYLTVADTVPTPAPGQGVYYVTSATFEGATRYGRKTTAGHLTGRDPALLPACTP